MPLISCPECGKSVSNRAQACPHCGYPINTSRGNIQTIAFGYEYKSSAMLFGMPLVHIATGVSPDGRPRIAKGVIAIGNIAIGLLALGGIAFGGIAFGGLSIALCAIGGLAIGILFGLGGAATGYLAVGGMAVGVYAIGGGAIGAHTLWNDPQMRNAFLKMLGGSFQHLQRW